MQPLRNERVEKKRSALLGMAGFAGFPLSSNSLTRALPGLKKSLQ